MTLDIAWKLHTVVGGGQTGSDQGGLIGAVRSYVNTGGTAPDNYKTSSGPNPLLEALGLNDEGNYQTRTKKNIKRADRTVIIAKDFKSAGTKLTKKLCGELNKLYLCLDISSAFDDTKSQSDHMRMFVDAATELCDFILINKIQVLNVAGNREPSHLQPKFLMTAGAAWIVNMALEQVDLKGHLSRLRL